MAARKPFWHTRRFQGAATFVLVQLLEGFGLLTPGTLVNGLEALAGAVAVWGAVQASEPIGIRPRR
jgi:hypothetical protein